jgi:hypothetical protein
MRRKAGLRAGVIANPPQPAHPEQLFATARHRRPSRCASGDASIPTLLPHATRAAASRQRKRRASSAEIRSSAARIVSSAVGAPARTAATAMRILRRTGRSEGAKTPDARHAGEVAPARKPDILRVGRVSTDGSRPHLRRSVRPRTRPYRPCPAPHPTPPKSKRSRFHARGPVSATDYQARIASCS